MTYCELSQIPLSTVASTPSESILKKLLTLSAHADITSFAVGLPSPDGFPVEAVAKATQEVLKQEGRRALQYSVTEGEPELREAIAEFETSRGTPTRPEEVQIVTGSQQALDLVARVFLDPGDRVLVENPSYLGALGAFRLCRPTFDFLPSDDQGLNPAAMTESCRGAKFAYVMPTFNNPTGLTISLERRKKLIEKADELGLWIIEDDPYGELWYEKQPPQTIRSLKPDNTLRLGTLSKILSPGMRLGYICGNPALLDAIAELKQSVDMHTPTSEAKNVPKIYRRIIGFIEPLASAFLCAMAFMTRINTSTGAIPFNARTKISPKIDTAGTAAGTTSAIAIPTIRPTMISFIKAISKYFFPIRLNK